MCVQTRKSSRKPRGWHCGDDLKAHCAPARCGPFNLKRGCGLSCSSCSNINAAGGDRRPCIYNGMSCALTVAFKVDFALRPFGKFYRPGNTGCTSGDVESHLLCAGFRYFNGSLHTWCVGAVPTEGHWEDGTRNPDIFQRRLVATPGNLVFFCCDRFHE